MNKIFKKAIACSMAVGTLVAGSAVALNTPTQALGTSVSAGVSAGVSTGVSATKCCSYCKNTKINSTSYSTCSGNHTRVNITGNKQDVTVKVTQNNKTTSYRYQVKSTSWKRSTAKPKGFKKTWTETKYVYLYLNGKKAKTMQKITRPVTQNILTKKTTYGKQNIIRYTCNQGRSNSSSTYGSYSIKYSYDKNSAKSYLEVSVNKRCKCQCYVTSKKFELKGKSYSGNKIVLNSASAKSKKGGNIGYSTSSK